MAPLNLTFIGKTQNYLHHGPPKLQNAINKIKSNGDLHRSKRISNQTLQKIPPTKEKLMKADYPLRFTSNVVNEFENDKDESFIIPPGLFEITKPFISIKIPYCEHNVIKSKH